ncbi:MAG: ATP-binding protein, partial [Caulobacteraceae bacterium]
AGIAHRVLSWTGEMPARGLAGAARGARHRLLAEAARSLGARVILMGHTADDRLEGSRMRRAGLRLSDPAEWAPSPVWPEGRGLFILRPLLHARRAALRAWLDAGGETWIEDPANDDPASPRARARMAGTTGEEPPPICADRRARGPGFAVGAGGDIGLSREDLAAAEPRDARRALGTAVLCAAGTDAPPDRAALDRLLRSLAGDEPFVASLAGARIRLDGPLVRVAREAGALRRAGARPVDLPPGSAVVWDGRFAIEARKPGLAVTALSGLAGQLPRDQARALRRLPADARGALPAIVDAAGAVVCPLMGDAPAVRLRPLIEARFVAACGWVRHEAAIGRVAETPPTP